MGWVEPPKKSKRQVRSERRAYQRETLKALGLLKLRKPRGAASADDASSPTRDATELPTDSSKTSGHESSSSPECSTTSATPKTRSRVR